MKRLCLLVLALLFSAGCLTEEMKQQWREVIADWNGDNMRMRSDRVEKTP
jgi:hypothetical protein